MSKPEFILFFLLLVAQVVSAQNKFIRVQGHVVDYVTNTKLQDVHILLLSKHAGTVTDKDGNFILFTGSFPETLKTSIIGYQTKYIPIDTSGGNLYLTLKLQRDTIMLEETVITGKQTVYNKKINDYSLLDYTFVDSNILILQNKLGFKRKKSLTLLNNKFDTLYNTTLIPKDVDSMYRDCLGNTHLISKDSAYQIWINKNGITLLPPVEINRFYSILKSCVLKKNNNYFFRIGLLADLGEKIVVIDGNTKKRKLFVTSIDSSKYEHYLNDVLHLAGMYPGYDIPAASVESDCLLMNNIRKYEVQSRFIREFVYRPVYNKLLNINDTLIYFNHIKSFIGHYAKDLKLLEKTPINYQLSKFWKGYVLKDVITHKTYTVYYQQGYFDLYEIMIHSGKIKRVARIPAFETNNIKVNNHYVYYLAIDHLSATRLRKLHRKKLN